MLGRVAGMRQNLTRTYFANCSARLGASTFPMILVILLIGLCAGVLVGLLGIGGGVVLVPALVHMLHMDQHAAQGTSLFVLLPPIGLGALLEYRKKGDVDLRAGIFCAIGMLFGGYVGGLIAVPMPTARLTQLFGIFLMISALLLWGKASKSASTAQPSISPEGEA
jgi:uncharacterized protein